jgi:hypothetical protein
LWRRRRWGWLLLAWLKHLRRIYGIVCPTSSLFLRLSSSIICVLIMDITLLVILAYGCGSLSLVLVLEIISHCVRVVGLTLRESINSTAKD